MICMTICPVNKEAQRHVLRAIALRIMRLADARSKPDMCT